MNDERSPDESIQHFNAPNLAEFSQSGEPDAQSSETLSVETPPAETPSIDTVYQFLMYGVSLPERALRSTSAMVGGAIKESAQLLVPQAFQTSRSYSIFVEQMLGLLTTDIGGVKASTVDGEPLPAVENYVARKAVGNFMEFAGMATLHLSPITVLALVSDIAYGSKSYLEELTVELKKEGVIAEGSTIENAAQLLNALENASGVTAEAFDLPPVSIDGLRSTIEQTRDAVSRMDPTAIIPQSELEQLWTDMSEMANKEDVSLFEMSSTMTLYSLNQVGTVGKGALSSIKVAGNMFDKHIIDHYVDSINEISEKGVYGSLAESSQPYLDAVWLNFSSDRETMTEDVLSGKMIGRVWTGMRGWFGGSNESSDQVGDQVGDDVGDENASADESESEEVPDDDSGSQRK